jgi:type I restriction enzyme, R subunit
VQLQDALVERPAIALFARLDYETINTFNEKPGQDSILGRETQLEVVLIPRLRTSLLRLNPGFAQSY